MIRLANKNDLEHVLDIIKDAQTRLKNLNINQWQNNYPNKKVISDDIKNKQLYVYLLNEQVVATMTILKHEPTYDNIDGKWLNNNDYIVVHRIAVKDNFNARGIGKEMLLHAQDLFKKDLKIDTHPHNLPMQKMLKSLNFTYCGNTYIGESENDLRYCYQKEYHSES